MLLMLFSSLRQAIKATLNLLPFDFRYHFTQSEQCVRFSRLYTCIQSSRLIKDLDFLYLLIELGWSEKHDREIT